jgi:hypothetical protein
MTLGNAALVLHRNASLAPPMRAIATGNTSRTFFHFATPLHFFLCVIQSTHPLIHSHTHTHTHTHTPLLPACPTQPELSEEESAAIMVTEKGPEEA